MHVLYIWLPTIATVMGLAWHKRATTRMLRKHMRQVNMISAYRKEKVDTQNG